MRAASASMMPGRSLPGNTSGRSIAPVAMTTACARTCHSRSRGRSRIGLRQMIGHPLAPGRSCCRDTSRTRWCAAATSRRAPAVASVSASQAAAGLPIDACSCLGQQRAAELRLLVAQDDARAGAPTRPAPRQARPGRRRSPARRNARSDAVAIRIGRVRRTAQTGGGADRRLVQSLPERRAAT